MGYLNKKFVANFERQGEEELAMGLGLWGWVIHVEEMVTTIMLQV